MRSLTDFAAASGHHANQAPTARSRRRSSAAEDADIRPRISSCPIPSSRSAPIRLRQSSSHGKREMPRRSHREPRMIDADKNTPTHPASQVKIGTFQRRPVGPVRNARMQRPAEPLTPVGRTPFCRRSPANTPGQSRINAPTSIKPGRKNPEAVGCRWSLIVAKARDRHTGLPLLGEGLDGFIFSNSLANLCLALLTCGTALSSMFVGVPTTIMAMPIASWRQVLHVHRRGPDRILHSDLRHSCRRREPRRPAACR